MLLNADVTTIRFRHTLVPFLCSWVAACCVSLGLELMSGEAATPVFWMVFGVLCVGFLAAGLVFVLPVLLMAPDSRQPPLWLSIPWGGGVATMLAIVLLGVESGRLWRWALIGGVGGAVYSLMASRISDAPSGLSNRQAGSSLASRDRTARTGARHDGCQSAAARRGRGGHR